MNNSSDNNTLSTGLGTIANDTYSYITNLLANPSVVIILVIVLVLYIILLISLGENSSTSPNEPVSNSGSVTITILFMSFFLILLIINGLQYFFSIDIIAEVKNLFTGRPEVDITIDTSRVEAAKNDVPQILLRPQVFNIPENKFVYPDAKALCSAYGARLATYNEIEDAYKNGAEWCNYGWSDGQMALFPTQQNTFDKLQTIEGHENDCGRPGINGGFIANPAIKFGVNCYGYRPRMTEAEKEIMETKPIYPKTLKDQAMEDRVNYWKDRLSEILVSPFNHNSWSKL
jgi:hypothetical protein